MEHERSRDDEIVGKRIGHYDVLALLGAGGMGRVYRARDTRLGRDVAIKILPQEWAHDSERLIRFEREARALAAMNHANIATIHGIEESEDRRALVLELIPGQTLADRLSSGPVEVGDALAIARQVADALEAAHEKGIVHRDLKPANVKITPSGTVKVLDFGLAKMSAEPHGGLSESPTVTVGSTRPGVVTGTAAYMSPEQARGLPVDQRTDVWAFGCLLYELLTRRPLFAAETMSDTLAAVLQRPVDWTLLPAATPAATRHVLQRCLERDPARRLRDIREARLGLESPDRTPSVGRPRSRWLAGVAAAAAVGLIATAVYVGARRPTGSPRTAPLRSVAVLPLRSLDVGADDTIALGITSDVITKVSQVRELTVRPMSAVRKYARQEVSALDAARELAVDAVLDGTLQRDGNRVRVNVNLLGTADGTSLWTDTFDVDAQGVFEIQDRLSTNIASRLRVSATAQESARLTKRYTSNADAYEAYLRGMLVMEDRTTVPGDTRLQKAVAAFERATTLDPSYALAYAQAGYANAYIGLFNDPNNPKWIESARKAADTAIRLDPQLAQPYLTRYELSWSRHENFNITKAIRELQYAQRLDPTVGLVDLGTFAAHLGLGDFAIRHLSRALEIDPTNPSARTRFVESQVLIGRYSEALAQAERLAPSRAEARTALAMLWTDDVEGARRGIDQDLGARPTDAFLLTARALSSVVARTGANPEPDVSKGVELAAGSRAFHHVAYNIASLRATQGRAHEAVEWLKKTVEAGMPNYPLFSTDPPLRGLLGDPEYVAFMADLEGKWNQWRREFENPQ